MATYYSTGDGCFNYETVEESIECELFEPKMGDEIIIFAGESKDYKPSQFVPDVVDIILDNAYDEAGEWCEGWMDGVDTSDLQNKIKELVDKWFTDNNHLPTFYAVENVRKILITILEVDEDYNVEFIQSVVKEESNESNV